MWTTFILYQRKESLILISHTYSHYLSSSPRCSTKSQQATRAKEGTGPGGHPLPTHHSRRSSLTAESGSQMAEGTGILEDGLAEQHEMYGAARAVHSDMTGGGWSTVFASASTSVASSISPTTASSSSPDFSPSSVFCSSSAYSSRTHSSNSHCCDDTSRGSPALPEMPLFLDEKERQYGELGRGEGGQEELELEEERRRFQTNFSGGGMREIDVVGASESPSPSQRAALSALYGSHVGAMTVAEEKEEEGKEGETEDNHLKETREEGEISEKVKRMLANHYLSDRPELKRYDSADAALRKARGGREGDTKGKKGGKHSQCEFSTSSSLSSHLKSELELGSSEATVVPTVLQVPPRMHSRRRSSEGFVEIQGLEDDFPDSREYPQRFQQQHFHTGSNIIREEEEEKGGPQQLMMPQLSRFDSGDYFMQKDTRTRAAAGNAAVIERPRAIQAQGEKGEKETGHGAVR